MPKLLEQVCLRVDSSKDAAGSPFDKADRLYLYLHVQKLSVEWGTLATVTSYYIITCSLANLPASGWPGSISLWLG